MDADDVLAGRAAREARYRAAPLASEPASSCPSGFVAWDRGEDAGWLCATECSSDSMCSPNERCRVLEVLASEDGTAVYADEMQDSFAEAEALALEADLAPIYDSPPECEGDCADYTGDLVVHPAVPFALCDPFHDVYDGDSGEKLP